MIRAKPGLIKQFVYWEQYVIPTPMDRDSFTQKINISKINHAFCIIIELNWHGDQQKYNSRTLPKNPLVNLAIFGKKLVSMQLKQ